MKKLLLAVASRYKHIYMYNVYMYMRGGDIHFRTPCVCVCACVRACVRACVCVCVHVCTYMYSILYM